MLISVLCCVRPEILHPSGTRGSAFSFSILPSNQVTGPASDLDSKMAQLSPLSLAYELGMQGRSCPVLSTFHVPGSVLRAGEAPVAETLVREQDTLAEIGVWPSLAVRGGPLPLPGEGVVWCHLRMIMG